MCDFFVLQSKLECILFKYLVRAKPHSNWSPFAMWIHPISVFNIMLIYLMISHGGRNGDNLCGRVKTFAHLKWHKITMRYFVRIPQHSTISHQFPSNISPRYSAQFQQFSIDFICDFDFSRTMNKLDCI